MSTSSNYYQLLTMNTIVGPVTLSHCLLKQFVSLIIRIKGLNVSKYGEVYILSTASSDGHIQVWKIQNKQAGLPS